MGELLRAEHLKKYFKTPSGVLHAVDDISFSIDSGDTLGVVGESGCGKSTLGRVILKLIEPTDGRIIFEGRDITRVTDKENIELRRKMQIIFQDPYSSLNPRMSVMDLIADPLKTFRLQSSADRRKKVFELMDMVGLSRRFASSYPHELDGGRRQRIGVARALALEPTFIVCDEPVSALDVSIQAQILNLLQDLQEQQGLTYIFVTHDLSVVKHISTDILVMYTGIMVEKCEAKELFAKPMHPYTKGLLSAIPVPNIDRVREKVALRGELTSPVEPKPECRFVARCPFATDICRREPPTYSEVLAGHFVSCHNVREINGL
ncbi:MAG: ATP-binding cassette domain-containing protein [Oscillospiraceae bacterium]|jgi:peptide/nickel transport system ATP-binding protein|nr:ATP-binding cassette domain-containing protein [Oscillospiraceae bacterium]